MLYYETYEGKKEQDWLVLVHGLGGSMRTWYKQIDAFKEHFNLLLIDLHGHGKTKDKLSELKIPSFEEIGKDIFNIMDKLEIPSAHFVGISLGTIIIRAMGGFAPLRIKTMILGGAVLGFTYRTKVLIKLGDGLKHVVPYLKLYQFFGWLMMPKKNHKVSRKIFVREAQKLGRKEFVQWFNLVKRAGNLTQGLKHKAMTIPKLYIMGDEDHMFIHHVKKECLRDLYSRLSIMKKSGHVCNIEQAYAFNEQTLEFLKSMGGPEEHEKLTA